MNKKLIYIINGSGGVGKDTFIEFCSEFARVKNISSIDNAKQAATILAGWNGEKDEKSRKLLVDLKRLSIEYNDYPVKYIEKQVEEFIKNGSEDIMFIHIREIDEIKKVKEKIDAKTILVTSNRVEKITSNSSDANVENYNYDYYIKNDGTLEELREIAMKFINH